MAVDQAKSKENGTTEDVSVLRIGVVKDRELVDERLIQPGQAVSVGSDSLCTFVIESEDVAFLGESFTLFESKGDHYSLIFTENMKGMIRTGDSSTQLDELISSQKVGKKGKNYQYQIEQEFKGKIAVGSYNFLFQFVKVPAVAIKNENALQPKLLSEDDYVFIGFLVLYMLVLSAGVLWVATQERPELLDKEEAAQLVAQYLDVPDEPEEELTPEPDDMPEPEIAVDPDKTVEKVPESSDAPIEKAEVPSKVEQDKTIEATKNMSADQRADAEAAVEQSFLFQALATTGNSKGGTFVSSAFGGDGGEGVDLDAILDGVTDGQMAQTDSQMKVKGQMDKSGRALADASAGTQKAGAGGKVGAGTGPKTTAPKSQAKVQKIEMAEGVCSDAITKTVRKYLAQVTSCHDSSLKSNPNVQGRVVVDVEIADGKVMMAKVSSNKTGDNGLGACIEKRINRWKFPPDCSDFVSLPFALSPKN